jgi:hypothetical protein
MTRRKGEREKRRGGERERGRIFTLHLQIFNVKIFTQ